MKTPTWIAACALALALAACGAKDETDPYLTNVPDVGALTLDTADAAPGATATGAAALAVDPAPVSSLENDLAVVREKARAMNEALRAVFAHLEALRAAGGTLRPGGVKDFGPVNRCVEPDGAGGCAADGTATLLLRVTAYGERAASFVLLARPTTSTSPGDFRPVLAGWLARGPADVERRGAGRLWVNHENLLAAAGGFQGRGFLAAGFRAGPVAKSVTYRMLRFTRDASDPATHPPVTAVFSGWTNGAGWVRARVAGFKDLDRTGPAEELGFWRGAWAPALGGRAFTVVANGRNPNAGGAVTGDVPEGKYWFARACYPAGQTTPSYKEWFLCDRVADGAPAACVAKASGLGAREPGVGDPSIGTWQETSCFTAIEPEELRPPGARPPHDGPDDEDPEDGAGRVGLDPVGCPTNVDDANPDARPPGMGGMPGTGGMM